MWHKYYSTYLVQSHFYISKGKVIKEIFVHFISSTIIHSDLDKGSVHTLWKKMNNSKVVLLHSSFQMCSEKQCPYMPLSKWIIAQSQKREFYRWDNEESSKVKNKNAETPKNWKSKKMLEELRHKAFSSHRGWGIYGQE